MLLAAAMGDRRTFAYTWVPDGEDDVRRYLAKALDGPGRRYGAAVRDDPSQRR